MNSHEHSNSKADLDFDQFNGRQLISEDSPLLCDVETQINNIYENQNYTPSDSPSLVEFSQQSPFRSIVKYSLPSIIDEIQIALLPMINQFYISIHNKNQLSGLSAAAPIEQIAPAIGWLFEQGIAIQISRYAGRGENAKIIRLIRTAVLICFLVSLIYSIVTSIFIKRILVFLGTQDDVLDYAIQYVRPLTLSGFVFSLDCALTGIAEGLGRTRLYTFVSVLPLIVNACIFEPILIISLKLGIRGAAISQILTQAISLLLQFLYFSRFDKFINPFSRQVKLPTVPFRQKCKEQVQLVSLGFVDFIAVISECTSNALCLYYLQKLSRAAGLYEEIIAMWGIIFRLNVALICLAAGINDGFLTTASYAAGEQDLKRFLQLNKLNYWLSSAVCTVTGLCFYLFAYQIFSIFGFEKNETTHIGVQMLRIVVLTSPILPFCYCSASYCQAREMAIRGIIISFLAETISQPILFVIMYYGFLESLVDNPVKHIIITMVSFNVQDVIGTIIGYFCIRGRLQADKQLSTTNLLQFE